ncbi:MAG: acetyl-CoA acetyltransferase [Pseudomonadota bacterium]
MDSDTTPIIIGAGQVMHRWDGQDADAAPSPQGLMAEATQRALADTGVADAVGDAVDVLTAVRIFPDSMPGDHHPFDQCVSLPHAVAARCGLSPARAIYSHVGGNVPQALVNEFADALHRGEARAVLLTGAEATAAMKTALRGGVQLDWSDEHSGEIEARNPTEDRGWGSMLLDGYELGNGLGAPPLTYPHFEHALRHRLGRDQAAHLTAMSRLWAGFAAVAATHPQTQFDRTFDEAFLATPSADNYPIADPYLKWHVAQDAVNQGAALVLTTVGEAKRLGVDPVKWIYLHGTSEAADYLVTRRPDLSRSLAMEAALATALDRAGLATGDIGHYDLYSCFPCAVSIAAEALGLDENAQPLTVTGGLPFFGGAGNNYSMHAIATMVERLRDDGDSYGLVLANGGFLSKEAVGIYSARPVTGWTVHDDNPAQAQVDAQSKVERISQSGTATIESYTIGYKRGNAERAVVIARMGEARILASTPRDERAAAVIAALTDTAREPMGRTVIIESDGQKNDLVGVSD